MTEKNTENKVLIVDDQAANTALLEQILKKRGYTEYKSLTDPRLVVQTFQEWQPDLLLLDLMMPHMSGFDVMEALKPLIPEDDYFPILVLTADIAPEARQRALSGGAMDFLAKPFDATEVVLRINNLLQTRVLHKQLKNQNILLEEKVQDRTAELRASEERFRALIENASDLIIVLNKEGKGIYIGPSVKQVLGYKPEELKGRTIADYVHPDDLPVALEAIAIRAQRHGLADSPLEFRVRQKDGAYRVLEVIGNNLLENPAVGGIVVNARDITERKQAEEAVHQRAVDLALINTLNTAVNQGESLEQVISLFSGEIKRNFDCAVSIVALPDAEKKHLTLRKLEVAPEILGRIEKYVDASISSFQLKIPITGEGHFARVAQAGVSQIINDDDVIAEVMAEFTENQTLKRLAAPVRKIMDIHSVVLIPLLAGGEVQGFTELARRIPFTEADMERISAIAAQLTAAISRKQIEAETRRRLQNIEALRAIDQAISGSFDLRLTLDITLQHVLDQLNVGAASVLLLNPRTQTLEYAAGRGFRSKGIERSRLRLGEGYAGRAALERCRVSVHDLQNEIKSFIRADLLAEEEFTCYHGVPLIAKGQVKGVLEVFMRSHRPDAGEWLNFLETLAGQAAIAVDNTTLFEGLQRANMDLFMAYDATIEGWSLAMDLRDKETEGHTLRVTETTLELARRMGVGEKELVHVRRGALLHDMGKMGVPDSILLKPGKLTDEEWAVMRQHPKFAFDMLHSIAYLRPALDIPYCHHEKWDGTGYPRGLKGEQTPLPARIFAVVDVYDALTSDRPYRKAWSKKKALEHIKANAGTHFDPLVVEAFLQLQQEQKP